jgi:hypothetical protein
MTIERGGLSDTALHGGMLTGFAWGRSALVLCCAAVLMACGTSGGGGGDGGGAAAAGGPVPLALLQGPGYAHCGWLADDEPMTLVFSHAMDPLTLSWNYNYSDPGVPPVWSTPTTVTITPTPTWPLAPDDGLLVMVNDAAGEWMSVNPFPQIYDHTGTAPYIYVSADTGQDSNTGLAPTPGGPEVGPVKTIVKGIQLASTPPAAVLAAASTTLVTDTNFKGYDATGTIAMAERVSLCGGFSADFATRDPAAHETIVVDTSLVGGGGGIPRPAVSASGFTSVLGIVGTTPATALEGFTLISAGLGANSTLSTQINGTSAALSILGGNLALRNTKIRMAGAGVTEGVYLNANTSDYQAVLTGNDIRPLPEVAAANEGDALYITGAAPLVEFNYIAGPGGWNAYGIWVDSTGAASGVGVAQIRNNYIDASASDLTHNAFGMWVDDGAVEITHNTIHAGTGSDSTTGLEDYSVSSLVQYNTIRGGGGGNSQGILTYSGTGTYDANTVSGGSADNAFGIVIAGGSNSLTNNLISGCGRYSGAAPANCWGVYITGATSTVVINNTINGGSASTASTGIYDEGAASQIGNNLVFTSAHGANCVQEVLSNQPNFWFQYNNLFDCGSIHYFDGVVGIVSLGTTLTIGTFFDTTLAAQNVVFDVVPGFVSSGSDPGQVDAADVNWHLQASSPSAVRGGGNVCPVNLSSPATDRDGNPRGLDNTDGVGGGPSLGAYISPTETDPGSGCELP